MDHAVHPLAFFSAALFASAMAIGAEVSAAGGETAGGLAQSGPRNFSPHAAALLAAGLPKVEPLKSEETGLARKQTASSDETKPANGIVRLPKYVVREPKLPTPQEIMTPKELENYAMNRYVGAEGGFDRGFLNLFTVAGLWKKIPVLGRFSFVGSETNAERGMRLYAEAERKRKMEELMNLMSLTKEAGDAAGADKIKHETDKTFIRRADFGK